MKNILFWLVALLLIACNKDDKMTPDTQSKTLLKLVFYDEFASSLLDSVHFSLVNENKTYILTKSNPTIHDLPKGVIEARISKKGFITQDYKVDFSKRDTIKDNIVLSYDDFILDVPQDSLFATNNRKTYSFQVRRNAGFTIDKPEWVRVDTTNISKFSIKIDITILKNVDQMTRKGEIVLSHKKSRRILPVLQYRKNKIVSAYATIAENVSFEMEVADEFEGFPSIYKEGNLCLSEIKYQNVEGKQISFSSGCVTLLRPIDYRIMLKNKGGVDTIHFQLKLYDKKIDLNIYNEQMNTRTIEGSSTHLYYTDSERKTIGIVNISDFTVEKRIKTPVNPKSIVYNPFNKSYYIMSSDDKIRILNMQSNEITGTIIIPKDLVNDHPEAPYVIPSSLQFNQDGLGFLVTIANNHSGNGFRTIETNQNNKVTVVTDLLHKHVHSTGVHPNNKDFYFNDAYSNMHYVWSPSFGKSAELIGRYHVLHHKNWAIDNNNYKLVDYPSKRDLGISIPLYGVALDKEKELFYGWSSYYSQNFLTKLDAKGNQLGRIPAYECEVTLSADGKYLFIYEAGNADLYRVNTDVFTARKKLIID